MSGFSYDTSPNVSCRSRLPSRDTRRKLKTGGYAIVLPSDEAMTRPQPPGSQAPPLLFLGGLTIRDVRVARSISWSSDCQLGLPIRKAIELSSGDQRGGLISKGAAGPRPTPPRISLLGCPPP